LKLEKVAFIDYFRHGIGEGGSFRLSSEHFALYQCLLYRIVSRMCRTQKVKSSSHYNETDCNGFCQLLSHR
jgi:hypothetical protein